MNPEEAIRAVKKLRQYGTETNQIEAKTAKGGFSKKWHDTFSSFSNKYGGIIIFGLSEDKNFKSEGIDDLKSLQCKIADFCKNSMYPQVNAGDRDEHMSDYEIYALQSYNDNVHEDLRPMKLADFSDLDNEELSSYLKKLRAEKPNLSKNTDEKIYKLSGIMDKESGKPTLAGIMVFGDYPQAYCPQLFVACSAFSGNKIGELGDTGQRFDDNKLWQMP